MDLRACFFCGNPITDKISWEHIFADEFLAYLDLKQSNVTTSLTKPTTYSRIRVPAHARCNNEIGSEVESYLLSIVKSMDLNIQTLSTLHVPNDMPLNDALRKALVLWAAKLYYGLLYWEAGLRNHQDPEHQRGLVELLSRDDFRHLRRCFVDRIACQIPSSVYYFSIPEPRYPEMRFDFGTGLKIDLIYLRIRQHLLVVTLGDANLVREWLKDEQVRGIQTAISGAFRDDPLAYLLAVAHVWAVRELLPIRPQLHFDENGIVNRSREGVTTRPPIDGEVVNDRAHIVYKNLSAKWQRSSQ